MRKILSAMYLASGLLAVMCMFALLLTVLIQIVVRLFGIPFDGIELSSYFLAGMTFFGLAYTWRKRGHIRITIVFDRLTESRKLLLDRLTCIVAAALCAYLTYHSVFLLAESYEYSYKSRGIISFSLWIPQIAVVAGLIMFFIAIVDDMLLALRGRVPNYRNGNEQLTVRAEAE